MKKIFEFKPRINKSNGQVTLCLKKKEMPKEFVDKLFDMKKIKFGLEGWE
jgi:hypothetical protein